eukprot:scaffold119892_cov30-Tisochrysis_lutea.AAC.2
MTAPPPAAQVGVVSYILLSGVMPFDPTRYREQPLTVTFPEHIFAEVSPEAKVSPIAARTVCTAWQLWVNWLCGT